MHHDTASLTTETLVNDAEQRTPTHVTVGETRDRVHEEMMIVGLVLVGEEVRAGRFDLAQHLLGVAQVSRSMHELISCLRIKLFISHQNKSTFLFGLIYYIHRNLIDS